MPEHRSTTARRPGHAASIWPACAVIALLAGCSPAQPPVWAGYVEGDYVRIATPVGGTLVALDVQRGDQVQAEAALYTLDDGATAAALAQARAERDAAAAQAQDANKGQRPAELAVVRAQLAQARTQAANAERELKRQRDLATQGFVSSAGIDNAATAAREAAARVAELTARVNVAELPSRADTVAAAQARVDAATAAVQAQAWRADQAAPRAPTAALVADTYYRVGEYVPAGQPVVSLLPPAARKARFFVGEAELGDWHVGDAVRLSCDGCGAPVPARVSYIAPEAEFTPPVIYSNAQRSRLVFLVEARPERSEDAMRLHPGQPLDVERSGHYTSTAASGSSGTSR